MPRLDNFKETSADILRHWDNFSRSLEEQLEMSRGLLATCQAASLNLDKPQGLQILD